MPPAECHAPTGWHDALGSVHRAIGCGRKKPTVEMLPRVSASAASRRRLFVLGTSPAWDKAIRALPGGEGSAYRLASRYVAGTRLEDARACAHRLAARGLASSIDFLGESVSDPLEADRIADRYIELAGTLDQFPQSTFLSIDLSHIGLNGWVVGSGASRTEQ